MTDYPLLSASLDPRYAGMPRAALGELVESIYGVGVAPEDVEGLFDDIGRGLQHAAQGVGRFAQQAAPIVGNALPSVAQGAASGAAFGPWGALIGAGAGLASGLLQQSNNRTARDIGGAIHSVGSLVSTVRGGGAGGGLGSLASVASGALGQTPAGQAAMGSLRPQGRTQPGGAANQLLAMLARPEMLQALMSSLMGAAGRQNVQVGTQQVPVSQMLAGLSQVAGRAAHEAAEFESEPEATPEYASVSAEVFGIDPEDAEGRADALLTLLALTPSIWMARQAPQISVSVNPNDPYFPNGESWVEDVGGEDWGPEAWGEPSDYDEVIHG